MNTAITKRLDDLFAELPVLVAGGPVSEHDLVAAERLLGLSFVPDYRSFVKRYGGAMVRSLPVFGLRTSEVMGKDDTVVAVTSRFRAQQWRFITDWAVLSTDGFGNPIGIASDGRVFVSDHDTEPVLLADSFEQFVDNLLNDRLASGDP
jgi:hypothetical protein